MAPKICLLLFALVCVVFAQDTATPRVHWFGDIEAQDLFRPPWDITDANQDWGGPLDPPLQKPQAYRTYTVCFDPEQLGGAVFFPGTLERRMIITFAAQAAAANVFEFKLDAPYLEIDPYKCREGAGQDMGNCRCNQPQPVTLVAGAPAQRGYFVQGSLFDTQTLAAGSRNITITIPNWTYFEHSPFPGQNPYMRTYRKLCMRRQGDATWRDTTIWIAVVHCCDHTNAAGNYRCDDTDTNVLYSYSWNKVTLPDATIDTNWYCNRVGWLGEFFDFQTPTPLPVTYAIVSGANDQGAFDGNLCWGETKEMRLSRILRNKCCGARPSPTNHLFTVFKEEGGAAFQRLGQMYGTCFNPQVEQCCGWKTYNPKFEKCCSKQYSRINYIEQHCKCDAQNEMGDCQRMGSNQWLSSTDLRGETDPINVNMKCCSESKFPDLTILRKHGMCYDASPATKSVWKCCTDGHIYDQGSKQCCPINGVQTLNTPCPCSVDTHCPTNQSCCLQQWPRSWTDGQGPLSVNSIVAPLVHSHCDKYANWPVGHAVTENQRCLGVCGDLRFQTCCNGVLCVREYERCCNSTCCNRFTSGCVEGTRPGTVGSGSRFNPNNFKVMYETCSPIEVFTTRRAFWVWVMPTFWLVATAISLAIVTVVARRAVENVFELTERAMVFFAVLLIGLGVPHYFNPTYKYGVVLVFVSLFTILGAVMRVKKFSLAVVVMVVLLLLYWIDPFEGNIFLSLTGGVSPTSMNAKYTSGIFEALFRLERNKGECTGFYHDYFNHDPMAHDFARFQNPNKMTFGFCTRAWGAALLIFSIVSLASILILLLLSIFSYTKHLLPEGPEEEVFNVEPENEYVQ